MKEAAQFGRGITAMVSPFDRHRELSIEGVITLANHLVDTGTDTIVVAGTTGESPNLTERERMTLINVTKGAVGSRAKVVAGSATNSNAESIKLSRQSQTEGADGLLLVTPYYNKGNPEGHKMHFASIADAVDIPCILYNVPGRTGINLIAETVTWLDHNHRNIVGLKEAVGISDEKGRKQVAEIIEARTPGFEVWSGNDEDTLPMMKMGAYGVVSVASHVVGSTIKRMMEYYASGDEQSAQELHDYLMPLFKALFPPQPESPSPAPIKAMLNMTGIDVGGLRLPIVEISDSYKGQLRTLAQEYKLV